MAASSKRSGPLAAGSATRGFLYSPPSTGKPPDPIERRRQRRLGLGFVIADVVVALGVGIPVGLLSANVIVGYVVGFGAMMIFAVLAIVAVGVHQFHERPSRRPEQS